MALPTSPGFAPSKQAGPSLLVGNHRQIAGRKFHQNLWPVLGVGVEEQAIPRFQMEKLIAMTVFDLALQHIQQLDAVVLEGREYVGFGGQRDQIGFDQHAGIVRSDMAQKVVLMARTGAAALDFNMIAGLDMLHLAAFLKAAKERGDRGGKRV